VQEFVVVLAGAAPLPRGLGRDHFSQHSRTSGLVAGSSQFEIPVCVRRTGRRNSKLRPALRFPVSPFPPSSLAPQPSAFCLTFPASRFTSRLSVARLSVASFRNPQCPLPCSPAPPLPRSPHSAIRNSQFEIETGARPLRPRIALIMQRPLMYFGERTGTRMGQGSRITQKCLERKWVKQPSRYWRNYPKML
jgi:hypothetical protein